MTTVTELPARRVPRDTFPNRLALVRTEMGWNYDQAEAATGVNSESWRVWEKGKRRCNDIEGVARVISRVTGFAWEWLMVGGPLDPPTLPPTDTGNASPTNPCLLVSRRKIGAWKPRRLAAVA